MKPDRTPRIDPRSCELSADVIAGIHRWYLVAGLVTEPIRVAAAARVSSAPVKVRKGRAR